MPIELFVPWKGPFKYNEEGQFIVDSDNQIMLDIRGWGWLTGKGSGGMKLDDSVAATLQDRMGNHVCNLLNADIKPDPKFKCSASFCTDQEVPGSIFMGGTGGSIPIFTVHPPYWECGKESKLDFLTSLGDWIATQKQELEK